jgi:hypothetical protein
MITPTLTYLLTPWSIVLLEKLVKKFPAFYGTGRFITAVTGASHLSISTNFILYFGHITDGA